MRHPSLMTLLAAALCTASLAPVLYAAQPAFDEQKLAQACDGLLAAPLAAGHLQTLAAAARDSAVEQPLRSRAMAAYGLALLLQGQTNGFASAARALAAAYPDAQPLLRVTADQAYAICDTCKGDAVQGALCPTCMGSGACKSCSGTGKRGTGVCTACKGNKLCPRCLGKKRVLTACPTCLGSTKVFKPAPEILHNYSNLLADVSGIVRENATFRERLAAANSETDTDRRIAAFQGLLQTFSHRADLGPAVDLMEKAVLNRDRRESERLAQEARVRERREQEALLALRDSPDIDAALATLDAYLAAHPQASATAELRALRDELAARRLRAARLRTALHIALGLGGLLLAALAVKALIPARRPRPSGPLPGLDKIDKRQFTDPLTLTAAESRTRVKTHTAQIPPDAG